MCIDPELSCKSCLSSFFGPKNTSENSQTRFPQSVKPLFTRAYQPRGLPERPYIPFTLSPSRSTWRPGRLTLSSSRFTWRLGTALSQSKGPPPRSGSTWRLGRPALSQSRSTLTTRKEAYLMAQETYLETRKACFTARKTYFASQEPCFTSRGAYFIVRQACFATAIILPIQNHPLRYPSQTYTRFPALFEYTSDSADRARSFFAVCSRTGRYSAR